jgi:hypothetical protein
MGFLIECSSRYRGTVLKRILALSLEIEMFMNEKGKAVAELLV